jgi:Glyoxalase/Bleomycin resistance protein/Dioxygenase superfamily
LTVSFSTPERQRFVQNAYHVRDLDEAIARYHRLLGIGPFVVRRHIALDQVYYRGAQSSLDISAAHAQAGDIQIELVTQHCQSPSTFRDRFAPDEEGLHHVALFPEDHGAMVAHYQACGFAAVTDLVTVELRGATYMDNAVALGHAVEIYRVNQSLLDFYALIADAADGWDGRHLTIEM